MKDKIRDRVQSASPDDRHRDLPIADRCTDLLARMTLEEKVGQLACEFGQHYIRDKDGHTLVEPASVGAISHLLRASDLAPREAARRLNAYQRRFVRETRLGIPALFSEEACCGPQVRGASMFPQAIALAASWDPDLIQELARVSSRQIRTLGVRHVLAPLCDVAQDPRWGRLEESYGEDPYLAGMAAVAFIRGMQGDSDADSVMATVKHFIAYSITDGGRNGHPTHVGQRTLREIFGTPFEMAIGDGGVDAVMCSYNAIDQLPVQSSRELLTGLLRDEYGFDGLLVSDLNSVMHLHSRHHTAGDARDAGVQALRAGLDVEIGTHAFAEPLIEAVRDGDISEAEVDRAVRRVLECKFRLGLFEQPYADEEAVPEVLETAKDRALARHAAGRSIVLLQNRGSVLPLSGRERQIAVIGPNAARPMAMLGDYAYATIASAIRLAGGDMDLGGRDDAAQEPTGAAISADQEPLEQAVETVPVVNLLDGIRGAVNGETDVSYVRGCPLVATDRSDFESAENAARAADVAIVAVGDQSSIGGIPGNQPGTTATVGEGMDSARCTLPGVQIELVEAIAATGTPVVLVMLHGRSFVLGDLADRVAAVVDAWFPGEEGGNAIADVLFGETSPSGKSPVSYHRELGVTPAPYNRAYGANTYYDAGLESVFPFGHGLGYTTFDYTDLDVSAKRVPTDGELIVSCAVTNSGDRAGDEVVQLYTRDPVARSVRPWIELKGFRRVHLRAGETARVAFTVAADRFALYDPELGWLVEPGRIELFVGASSGDIRLTDAVELTGNLRRVVGNKRVRVTPTAIEPVD